MKPLWSDDKSEDDVINHAQIDSDIVIYNLLEDIKCLREDNAKLSDRIYKHNCRVIGAVADSKKFTQR